MTSTATAGCWSSPRLVGALAIGGSLGLLLAGLTRQHLSLPATLWIPAVLTILAVPVAALLVPETTVRTSGRVDWAGAGLLGLGLVLLLVAVGNSGAWGWVDARTLGGIGAGVAALAAWVAVERRVQHPFVDLSLVVRHRRGVGGAVFGAVFAAVMAALLVSLPGMAKPITSEAGYVTVWLVCSGLAVGVGVLALWLRRDPADRLP